MKSIQKKQMLSTRPEFAASAHEQSLHEIIVQFFRSSPFNLRVIEARLCADAAMEVVKKCPMSGLVSRASLDFEKGTVSIKEYRLRSRK